MLRLRRTATGLFKGSILVQFKDQSDAEKFLAEPQEWNGSLLDAKTKNAWIKAKKEEEANLPWEERREREKKRQEEGRFQKPFSAFKEMGKTKESTKQGRNNRDQQGRRGRREDRPRNRSRSPAPVQDSAPPEISAIKAVAGQKRPLSTDTVEEAPSLFSNKREKLDNTSDSKRPAEEELKGESKKIKVDGQ
jgi:hypothetical protein